MGYNCFSCMALLPTIGFWWTIVLVGGQSYWLVDNRTGSCCPMVWSGFGKDRVCFGFCLIRTSNVWSEPKLVCTGFENPPLNVAITQTNQTLPNQIRCLVGLDGGCPPMETVDSDDDFAPPRSQKSGSQKLGYNSFQQVCKKHVTGKIDLVWQGV